MKLKDILIETQRDFSVAEEDLMKVDEIAESGKWIIKKPWLYRGRGWDEKIKIKDTEIYDKRKTRDTGNLIDYLIHDYTLGCYSGFPDRRQSRFALTHHGDARTFGDEIYVIFPEKGSKLVYSNIDSYDILVDRGEKASGKLLDVTKKFFTKEGKKRASYSDYSRRIDYSIHKVLSGLYDIVRENKEVSISQYGCPKEILNKLEDLIEEFDKRNSLRIGFTRLKQVYEDVIQEYFSLYDKGYPPDKESGRGEVIYQGEYVQVHKKVWDKYLEKGELS